MSLMYLKNVVTLKYDKDKCSGCAMCINVCPHGVFALNNGKAEIVYRDKCMECGACAKNCSFNAIYVRPGVGCAAAIVFSKLRGKKDISCNCS